MQKVMGFWRCWGLVIGIVIGNGIFMLPAILAPYGKMSLLGWVLAGIGSIFIALMFGLLAKRNPMVGGHYAYTRAAFGDLAGFLIGWGYWIAILTAIAAGALFIGDTPGSAITASKGEATLQNISEMIMIIMWAYIGIEAVTLPADDMFSPQKNIPKALIVGTLTVMTVYLLVSYGVMALVPLDALESSTSPIADAASVIFGHWGAGLVAIVALVSIISSTNANIFIVGVIPQTMAQDKNFPKYFSSLNKSGVPAVAIIFSGVLASLLVAMNFSDGLIETFKTLILLSTLATLLPYITSAMAELVFQQKEYSEHKKRKWSSFIIAFVALIFSIFALIGSGLMIVLQGTILIVAGLPFYYWSKTRDKTIAVNS